MNVQRSDLYNCARWLALMILDAHLLVWSLADPKGNLISIVIFVGLCIYTLVSLDRATRQAQRREGRTG